MFQTSIPQQVVDAGYLGRNGQILLAVIGLAGYVVAAYHWWKSSANTHLEKTVVALEKEIAAVERSNARLVEENGRVHSDAELKAATIAELQAKTDITRLEAKLAEMEKESHQVSRSIVEALQAISAQRDGGLSMVLRLMEQVGEAVRENSRTLSAMNERISEEFACNKEAYAEMVETLRVIKSGVHE